MKPQCVSLPELSAEIYFFPDLRQAFPPHFHDAVAFGCLLGGRREVELESSRQLLETGDCAIFPAGAIHACKPADSAPAAWICLHLRQPLPGLRQPLLFADKRLGRLFGELATLQAPKIIPLVQESRQYLAGMAQAQSPGNAQPSPGAEIRIARNYAEKIGLAELAKAEHLGKYSFLRSFKARAGITPYRYLEAARITHSQSLLRSGASLANCALKSGFYDQSHFSRCFKARLGITPGSYAAAYPATAP